MNGERFLRRVWTHGGMGARAARWALLPAATVYQVASYVHRWAYESCRLAGAAPAPTIGVGNLALGGAGKTPIAGWIARWYIERGLRPGVLLRDYGGDEAAVHRRTTPEAVVVADPNRVRAARRAVQAGAGVLVLDDAFQHHRMARDLDLVLVSAESLAASRWTFPAGPWRERPPALARADFAVLTVKRASREEVRAARRRLSRYLPEERILQAALRPVALEGMRSGAVSDMQVLAGRRVLVTCGIADPWSCAEQVARLGASVTLMALPDHYSFGPRDVARILTRARVVDYVVVTMKDAVKLAGLWPADAPEPLVVKLLVRWEAGGDRLAQALSYLPTKYYGRSPMATEPGYPT